MTLLEYLNEVVSLGVVFIVGYGDRVDFTHIEEPRPDGRGVVYRPGLPILKTLEYVAPDDAMTDERLRWLRRHREEMITLIATLSRAERAAWTTPDTRPAPTTYHSEPCVVKSHGHHKPGATTDEYYFPSGICVERWRNRKTVSKKHQAVELWSEPDVGMQPDDGGAALIAHLERAY